MLSDLLLLGLHSGAREAFAYPVEDKLLGGLGGQVGSFFALFSHLGAFVSHFWGLLRNHALFNRFFSNFHRFLMDLERILDGFWEDFWMIFAFFLKMLIL